MFPDSTQGKKAKLPNLVVKLSSERVRQARVVHRYSPKLLDDVIAGKTPLNDVALLEQY
jgi:hypothetical protein